MSSRLNYNKESFVPLDVVDGRTPEQLRQCGDHVWPDGRRYTPPHLTGEVLAAFVRRQDELDTLEALHELLEASREALRDAAVQSGGSVCMVHKTQIDALRKAFVVAERVLGKSWRVTR